MTLENNNYRVIRCNFFFFIFFKYTYWEFYLITSKI